MFINEKAAFNKAAFFVITSLQGDYITCTLLAKKTPLNLHCFSGVFFTVNCNN